MASTDFVTAGKPKAGGAAFVAPCGTGLPTSATAALAEVFRGLGYISSDGVTNANSPSGESVKAWGGDEVLHYQTEKPDSFKFTMIEAMNADVLKVVYGDNNVTGDLERGLAIRANSEEQVERAWVFDMVLKGGVAKRVVVPKGKVTAVEEIVYKDNGAVGYGVTVSAAPGEDGDTHKEYMVRTKAEAAAHGEQEDEE